jgi:hypothetical protein
LIFLCFSLIADQFQALGSAIVFVCSVVSDANATAPVQVAVNILKNAYAPMLISAIAAWW